MSAWDDVIPESDLVTMGCFGRGEVRVGERAALLIVDMTYAFVDDRFPLGHGETGRPCADAISGLLDVARDRDAPVLFTAGRPARNAAERGLWKSAPREPDANLPDPNEIVPVLRPRSHETIVHKRRPSAFFGTELSSLLAFERIDTVVLCGMVTSGCVYATAVDAFSHNLHVIVPEECVADRARVPHAVSLFCIHMKYGGVVTADQAAAVLAGQPLAHVT